ncbi:MAG: sulfite oxidase [Betaproteobacteria bacterium]|nr:sulfite oxidase [Betaproteobacteria bacterium]
MDHAIDSRRRRLMLSSAFAATGLGPLSTAAFAQAAKAKPLPKYAEWKYIDSLIVHSSNTIETRRAAFGSSVVVPTDILFVRNNIPPPEESIAYDPDAWEITVQGVGKPGKMTVGQLKRLGVETVAMVLQCSGNGRGFFAHKASGTQWTVGAAGCVLWSGVPLAAVVKAMGGVAGGMQFVTGSGGERIPDGIDRRQVAVERSVPLKAMETALLAWELNGEPLPLAHGGPLRLVIPGYYGVNNVKYLSRLSFTEKETDANIQSSGYRIRDIGKKGAPGQPTMWEMNVKSWINHPAGDGPMLPGMVQINGVAFAGVNAVRRVEVSTDGGKTWTDARFIGPDLGRYAWRQFVLPVQLRTGSHVLVSRATDAAGNVQPAERTENERGYGHNGWRDHAVKLTVA